MSRRRPAAAASTRCCSRPNRRIAGRLDAETGTVVTADISDPDGDDVLDDLAEGVIRTGGEVVIVPADRMPSRTGLAAIYRY